MGMNLRSTKIVDTNASLGYYVVSSNDDVVFLRPTSSGVVSLYLYLPKNPPLNQVLTLGILGQFSGSTISLAQVETQNNDIIYPPGATTVGGVTTSIDIKNCKPVTLVYTEIIPPSQPTILGNFTAANRFVFNSSMLDVIRVRVGDIINVLGVGSGSASLLNNKATVRETDGSSYLVCDPVFGTATGATIEINSKRGLWIPIA